MNFQRTLLNLSLSRNPWEPGHFYFTASVGTGFRGDGERVRGARGQGMWNREDVPQNPMGTCKMSREASRLDVVTQLNIT